MIHKGQIVEKLVRKSGFTFTNIATKLRISRNTLYNRLQNPNLSYRFIAEIGEIIHYDFSLDFPELAKEMGEGGEPAIIKPRHGSATLWRVENKYTSLLEKYNKLLALLVKIANQNELQDLKDGLLNLIEKDKEEEKEEN